MERLEISIDSTECRAIEASLEHADSDCLLTIARSYLAPGQIQSFFPTAQVDQGSLRVAGVRLRDNRNGHVDVRFTVSWHAGCSDVSDSGELRVVVPFQIDSKKVLMFEHAPVEFERNDEI